MNQFNRLNKILGWVVFALALATYTITMEKTGSLWDCGEFLSCTHKLQVAHPPGAPFYMIVGKIFSLLAMGDTTKLAMCINFLSALSTAFCSLFFFWSCTMLLKIAFFKEGEELNGNKSYLILFGSFLAAMSATFLDSMWFNALEGEVYAFSVFFMAFNVWAILKWNEDDTPTADYWLLLIALCTGMSIGVHLLSLLVFPIITLIFYFKKFKPTWIGAIISFVISIVLIQFVMKVVLSMTSSFLGKMDLLFVNTFSLPFFSGSITAILLIIAGFYFLIKKTAEKRDFLKWNEEKFKIPLNTVVLFFAFLFMGYTSYFLVVIRASANTPINMNVPDNFLTLKSYIDREQYGDRPLLSGPNYTDVGEIEDYIYKSDIYVKNKTTNQYDLVGQNRGYKYPSRVKKLFPRLGHEGDDKKSFYRMWIQPKFDIVDRATGEVIQTFDSDQAEQAEQFAAQQNATAQPGQFAVKDKLSFIDNITYFMQYQVGFMYFRYLMWNTAGKVDDHQGRANNDFGRWTSGFSFFDNFIGKFWGNVGLDQTGKPAVAKISKSLNNFYMIPFLLCIIGMIYNVRKDWKSFSIILLLVFATGVMQVVFHNEPPVEPRERDYVYAPSYWAFIFWLPFGILCLYNFLKDKVSASPAFFIALILGAAAPILMGTQGWDDHNRGNRTSTLAFAKNMLNSCPPNAILFCYGDNDTYPLWYAQEVEGIRPDIRVINTSLIEGDAYISQLRLPMNLSKSVNLSIPQDKIKGDSRNYFRFSPNPLSGDTLSITEIVEFLMSDDERTKVRMQDGSYANYLPTTHAYIDIDPAKAVASKFLITKDKLNSIPNRIYIELPSSLTRGALIQLDVIANNMYERPVCFASSNPSVTGLGIKNYLQSEGMLIKFTPTGNVDQFGMEAMNSDEMYGKVMSYDFGKIKENNILLDEHTLMSYNGGMKPAIANLAMYYALRNQTDTTVKLLDHLYNNMPVSRIPYSYIDMPALQAAYLIKNQKYIKDISEGVFANSTATLDWLTSAKNSKIVSPYQDEVRFALSALSNMKDMAARNGDNAMTTKIDQKFKMYEQAFGMKLTQ